MTEKIQQKKYVEIKNTPISKVVSQESAPVFNAPRIGIKEGLESPHSHCKSNENEKELVVKELKAKYAQLQSSLNKTKSENGFIGKSWDWIKNKTSIGQGSDETQVELDSLKKQIEDLEKISSSELGTDELEKIKKGELTLKSEEAVKNYKEGQTSARDITSDVAAGVVSFGIYTGAVVAAPFTFGSSLAVGVVAAGSAGAAIKTGIKYADAKSGGREYDSLGSDLATGAFSGILAPVSGGIGGAAAKGIAVKSGMSVFTHAGEEVFKEGIKTVLTNPAGYKYIGGTAIKRAGVVAAEMAVDGTVSGAVDNTFRAAINGDNISQAFVDGAVGGVVVAPIIGGSFRGMGKVIGKVKSNAQLKKQLQLINARKLEMGENEIQIPKCNGFSAPRPKFAETDEAFVDIVRQNTGKFKEINKKSGDEFIESAFELIKKEMGLEGAPVKLKITNDDNKATLTKDECAVYISRNWAGISNGCHVAGKGDKAEIAGAIAHELNHILQNKEGTINALLKNNSKYLFEYLDDGTISEKLKDLNGSGFVKWVIEKEDGSYISNHTEFYQNKAQKYIDNWEKYVQPEQNYHGYRNQTIEKESFTRGDIVVENYKNLILNGKKELISNSSSLNTSSAIQVPRTKNKIGALEMTAIKQIEASISGCCDEDTKQVLISLAVKDLLDPKYATYSVEQFVSSFLKKYTINL